MFHVTTHAFFKALLFLGSGSVIHAMSGEQDIRNMGGLAKKLPITFITFLIGTIAIAGIPPFAGFFSKDEILAHAYEKSPLLWALGVVGALMTTFYMFRLLFLTFTGSFRGTEDQKHHLHESPLIMTIPLMVLAVLSVVGGFIGVPEVLGGSNKLAEYLSPVIFSLGEKETAHALSHSTEYMLMGISTGLVVVTIIVAYILYVSKKSLPVAEGKEAGIQKVLYNKYYIDELYDSIVVKPLKALSGFSSRVLDNVVVDGIVNGVGKGVEAGSKVLRYSQSGSISTYLFAMVIGIILLLIVNLVK
jgi:NADH-quinone oxidoreductase subunit L